MKNLSLATLLIMFMITPFITKAQLAQPSDPEEKNMVKFNVLTLLGGNFAFEYERLINDRISVGGTLNIRPKNGIPYSSTFKAIINDDDLDELIDKFSSSNFSIIPEARFYVSKRGPFSGFYVAPYLKFTSHNASLPFDFDIDVDYEGTEIYSRTETIPLEADISSFTAGVSFGVNFKLSQNFYLDWRILGPGYGTANGDIAGKMSLNAQEQSALRESLAELKTNLEDMPLSVKIDYEVNDQGTNIKLLRSPWAGIRSGLSIAYRF